MNLDNKLKYFYAITVAEAQKQSAADVEEHKNRLKALQAQRETACRNASAEELQAARINLSAEINQNLSAEQMTLRQSWSRKVTELREMLFTEVKTKLKEFMASPAYQEYLVQKIREAEKYAGNDELVIWLSREDEGRLSDLQKQTRAKVQVSQDSFLGGIKAVIPSRNLLINDSFLDALQSEKESFQFDGGQFT